MRLSRGPLIGATGLVAGLAAVAMVAAFAWPDSSPPAIVRAGTTDDYSVNEPVHFSDSHFWLVRLSQSEFIALSDRDTHFRFATDDCPIEWRTDIKLPGHPAAFRGRCSGSTFDASGQILFGPSPRSMDRYHVGVVDDEIVVDTRSLLCAPGYEQSTVPLDCPPPGQYRGIPPPR